MPNRTEFLASLKLVPVRTMLDYVEARGYRATPITNHVQFLQEGGELVVMGYELRGPRGNRKVIEKGEDGMVSLASVELWCDMIDYSSAKLAERRIENVRRRTLRKSA